MELNHYQVIASNFAAKDLSHREAISVWALGLCGESGEAADLIKKHLGHGHELDHERLKKELGDILWYVSAMATQMGWNLNDIALANIEKLNARYPDGFSSEASINRRQGDE